MPSPLRSFHAPAFVSLRSSKHGAKNNSPESAFLRVSPATTIHNSVTVTEKIYIMLVLLLDLRCTKETKLDETKMKLEAKERYAYRAEDIEEDRR